MCSLHERVNGLPLSLSLSRVNLFTKNHVFFQEGLFCKNLIYLLQLFSLPQAFFVCARRGFEDETVVDLES